MNGAQWLDLHGPQGDDYHTAILDAAYREHKGDQCPECGAFYAAVSGTRYGYEVTCAECGATILEVDLD